MKTTRWFLLVIIIGGLLGIFRSDGATISYTVNVTNSTPAWTNTVYVHQFPSLGQLYKVTLSTEWHNHRTESLLSFALTDLPYEISYDCTVKLIWPDGTNVASEQHGDSAAGTIGISGAVYNSESQLVSFFNASSCHDFPPVKVLPYSWVGTGTIPFKVSVLGVFDLGVTDTLNIFPILNADGFASVTVTYFYTPGLTGTAFPCH